MDPNHKASVHDAQIDPTSKFLVTCSSDRSVSVFARASGTSAEATNAEWVPVGTVRDHTGSVQRVAWAHPAMGGMLATGGTDRVIMIYRVDNTGLTRVGRISSNLNDAAADIAFGPRQFMNYLAIASDDGFVRVIHVTALALPVLKFAPDDFVKPAPPRRSEVRAVAWCPSITEPYMVIAAGTANGHVVIYAYEVSKKKTINVTLEQEDSLGTPQPLQISHSSPIVSMTWAPAVGRRFQMLAVCSQSRLQVIYIQKAVGKNSAISGRESGLTSPTSPATSSVAGEPPESCAYRCRVFNIDLPGIRLQRVSWNRSATVLGGIGDDQQVRLWQRVPNTSNPAEDAWELIA